jgi:hypothetical protein
MPVIKHNGKWFRIAIEEEWTFAEDERRLGFKMPGVKTATMPKTLHRAGSNVYGTWQHLGSPEVHLVPVCSMRDWEPIYEAIAEAEKG